jgi:D-glycerate 3-kinase
MSAVESNAAAWKRRFLKQHRLPVSYLETAARFFDPLAAQLADAAAVAKAGSGTFVVGLNGSQGSGKSTLSDYLCTALEQGYQLRSVALSLDDFYLTRAERQALAAGLHPLFITRGVPGTHDVSLLEETLDALSTPCSTPAHVPRFDKAMDDRAATAKWTPVTAPVDVVILEGWCLGARHQDPASLLEPLNQLERDEDPEGVWRGYSNRQLAEQYEALYARLDYWLMLAAPGFEQVFRWRSEQEQKLREAVDNRGRGLMSDAQLQRFVDHFERFTRLCLRDLPAEVDVLLQLDDQRQIVSSRGLFGGSSVEGG